MIKPGNIDLEELIIAWRGLPSAPRRALPSKMVGFLRPFESGTPYQPGGRSR
jgi:hypothetical protein